MNKQEIIRKWTEENQPIGEMLGYPECCVKAFCDMPPELMTGDPTETDKMRVNAAYINGNYTGFIPCADHAKKVMNCEITLESLVDNEKRMNNEQYFIPEFPFAMSNDL